MQINWPAAKAIVEFIGAAAAAITAVIALLKLILIPIKKLAAVLPKPFGPVIAPPPPVPVPLQAAAPDDTPVLRGTATGRIRTPRYLDLVVKGNDLSLFMHPPGNRVAGAYMTASIDEIRRCWNAGERTLAETGNKRLRLKLPADNANVPTADDPNVPTGLIRIQLGTPSGEWWMYAYENDFNEAMQAVGAGSPTEPVPVPLQADPPPNTTVLKGKSPGMCIDRQLDLVINGSDLFLSMHPPDRVAGAYMTASIDEIRRNLDAGERLLAQTGKKRFRLKLPADNVDVPTDDDPNVPTGKVRIQLGTRSAEFWMYAYEKDFNEAMRAVGAGSLQANLRHNK